ncbi:uncharacterized protein MONBRDRAFT_35273 [Monosiga brevicollis MX1]|uniref:Protein kinase domain-containing protein n=1 Tax=Monosiga brevicollis TaxID=81824 RepID=A9V8H1_MONBE|nr:uncharacterized protein MONBRDRAFT_35273 [Monosiga brevicollis MX1]EDQ86144.1 predicted protein [Monosiga brevicollis MX1]|eukprot:XP_001749069.1 hypothetical protein [Monosiga brevicollis MX1]
MAAANSTTGGEGSAMQHISAMANGVHTVHGHIIDVGPRYGHFRFVGEGSYGVVVSAKDSQTGQRVAIKKMLLKEHLSFSRRTLREIKILTRLEHECIINVIELIAASEPESIREVYLVLRLMEMDLYKLIKTLRKRGQLIPHQHTSYWSYQILKALKYLHSANVLHRDLKPQNILINSSTDCALVICDFGLARVVDPDNPEKLSEYVATRWYRAPEITVSTEYCDQAMDIWSVGCILGECITGRPLFPSRNAVDHMNRVLDLVGSPSDDDLTWIPKESTRSYLKRLDKKTRADFATTFPGATPEALEMLEAIMQFDPRKRPSADKLIAFSYFHNSGYRDPNEEV